MATRKAAKLPPLDGGWGWMVVIGSTLSHFLVVGMGRSFGIFYLALLDFFGRSAAETAWVVAIYNTMRMMLGPLVGVLCDRYTCQRVVIIGGLILGAGCIISAFATSLVYLYITFGLIAGIGGSMLFTPSYVIVGQYFDKKKGKAMSISTAGSGLGTVALAPLISFLLHQYSFFGAMLILGAIMLNNLVSGLLYRPLYKNYPTHNQPVHAEEKEMKEMQEIKHNPVKENEANAVSGDANIAEQDGIIAVEGKVQDAQAVVNGTFPDSDDEPGVVPSLKHRVLPAVRKYTMILKNSTFLLYGFHITAMSICIQTFLSFLPAIAEEYGADKTAAALLLSILGIADMAGRFLFGVLFDLKTVRYRRRLFHAILGLPVGGFCILNGFMSSYIAFLIVTILFGIVEGGFHSQRASVVSEFVPRSQLSYTVGFVIFFQGFGNLLGPPVGGVIKDKLDSYNACYFFSGACLFLTSILFIIDYFAKQACGRRENSPEPSKVL